MPKRKSDPPAFAIVGQRPGVTHMRFVKVNLNNLKRTKLPEGGDCRKLNPETTVIVEEAMVAGISEITIIDNFIALGYTADVIGNFLIGITSRLGANQVTRKKIRLSR